MLRIIKGFFESREPLFFFLIVFFLIAPGSVYLFLWQRDVFMDLDWVKLIIISGSMLVPAVLINTIIFLEIEKRGPSSKGKEIVNAFSIVTIFSGLSAFVVLGVSYFYGTLIWNAVIAEVFLLLVMLFEEKRTQILKNIHVKALLYVFLSGILATCVLSYLSYRFVMAVLEGTQYLMIGLIITILSPVLAPLIGSWIYFKKINIEQDFWKYTLLYTFVSVILLEIGLYYYQSMWSWAGLLIGGVSGVVLSYIAYTKERAIKNVGGK
jgi:hypothetical protein